MAQDPYATLGVDKTASAGEIKKAYRKLVRTSHPDLNPDDPRAEARFKAISAAHDLLKDPATRARFDAGEIDATGAERPQRPYYRDFADSPGNTYRQGQGFAPGIDPEDIFAEILRQRGQWPGGGAHAAAPGHDLRFTLQVGFLDAARGASLPVNLPGGASITVKIPQGTMDGQTLRLRGQGGPGFGGGPPGDALITLSVAPHPVFRRVGNDIHVTLPITFAEAVLGAKVTAPTIGGPVSLTIPAGASTGRVLRLRGRGVPATPTPGDQLVDLTIVAPPVIDDALRDFFATWSAAHPQDPRKDMLKAALLNEAAS